MNHLAANLRRLRKAAALTQQQLADMAKLPRATLASMERDGANPGLDSVVAVAVALNIGLDELVSPPPEHRFFKVSEDQVKEVRADAGRFVARLLSPIASRGAQVQQVQLRPGCDAHGRAHPMGSQEFFFPYQGTAELVLQDEVVTVESGALVQFPGHLPHVYRNRGRSTDVLAFSVITYG
ncbi:MAG: XRE family transcriptional regulator [Myxococcales bacterium]|nr:XRE family transcriptional regulator [Myxococcales bacterium]MDD9969877.1 XRE family transcriptional regulator [Myxococcales bacterium]